MKYRVCPKCGAHLDHGEPCDCEDRVERETAKQPAHGMRHAASAGWNGI